MNICFIQMCRIGGNVLYIYMLLMNCETCLIQLQGKQQMTKPRVEHTHPRNKITTVPNPHSHEINKLYGPVVGQLVARTTSCRWLEAEPANEYM